MIARVLIHSGLRSIGTAALRASIRSNGRPSGASVIRKSDLGQAEYGVPQRAEPLKS